MGQVPSTLFSNTFIELRINTAQYAIAVSYPTIRTLFLEKEGENLNTPWKKDFQDIIDKEHLLIGHLKITNLITSESWRETQLKIYHRAYSVFFRPLADTNESEKPLRIIPKCPKCLALKPTLKHALWTCPMIENFWKQVQDYASQILKVQCNRDPLLCLFGMDTVKDTDITTHSRPVARWEHLCYLAAKRAILTNWIETRAPTIEELKTSLKKLFLVERLDAELISKKQLRMFAKSWQAYMAFNYTKQEQENMMQCPMYGR